VPHTGRFCTSADNVHEMQLNLTNLMAVNDDAEKVSIDYQKDSKFIDIFYSFKQI